MMKFIQDTKRILKLARKPTGQDIRRSLKVVILGLLATGVLGFILKNLFLGLLYGTGVFSFLYDLLRGMGG